jgi:hypothetical protein
LTIGLAMASLSTGGTVALVVVGYLPRDTFPGVAFESMVATVLVVSSTSVLFCVCGHGLARVMGILSAFLVIGLWVLSMRGV